MEEIWLKEKQTTIATVWVQRVTSYTGTCIRVWSSDLLIFAALPQLSRLHNWTVSMLPVYRLETWPESKQSNALSVHWTVQFLHILWTYTAIKFHIPDISQKVPWIDKSRYDTPWKSSTGISPLLHLRLEAFCLFISTDSRWTPAEGTAAKHLRAGSAQQQRVCCRLVMCMEKARICTDKCLIRTRSRVVWRRAPGQITGVCVSKLLSRWHLSERCNCEERWAVFSCAPCILYM